jgi:chaperone required for assembly of F1-ATPase
MRDILNDLADGEPESAYEKAKALSRRELPKRFYTEASVTEGPDGWAVLLDGRPLRTPSRRPVEVPDRALAEALAGEWRAQGTHVDPGTMPLTRIVNSTIDGVADEAEAVADEVARYAGSDLLFYRAGTPERLAERQTAAWDPLVAWAEERFGVRFRLAEGVMPVEQDPAALAAVRAAIPTDPWMLAALHTVTTLTGSAVLALAVAERALPPDAAWAGAHIDEDWNAELWGEDEEAAERRAFRKAEFDAAVLLMRL